MLQWSRVQMHKNTHNIKGVGWYTDPHDYTACGKKLHY